MRDPKNELTISVMQPATAKTANWNSTVIDTEQYVGTMAVILNAGAKTAGDAGDTTLNVRLYGGNESNGANAVILNNNFTQVTTTNSLEVIQHDPRSTGYRYLKAVAIIAGTNSPSFPVAMEILGTKKLQ
jgi:hypothetical protein